MSPAGFEPTTYGLKVPEPSDKYSTFEEAQCDSAPTKEVPTLDVRWAAFEGLFARLLPRDRELVMGSLAQVEALACRLAGGA
jgi:hypothetical protein